MFHRDNYNITTFQDASYWENINPELSLIKPSVILSELELVDIEKKKKYYNKYGFVGIEPDKPPEYIDLINRLEVGVENLVKNGWPAIFIYMYNETYEVIRIWNPILVGVNSNSVFLGDIYAWKTNRIGWGPHRDRMASDSSSFREDGSAMLSTTWLPLTNVTTHTSCMNFIPAVYDPNYKRGDSFIDNNMIIQRDTIGDIFGNNIQNYQRIRPMPISKGSALHFTHRVIHWGSAVDPEEGETPNRIAMSWVVGDTKFEEPAILDSKKLFLVDNNTVLLRLAFISGQIINYAGQTGMNKHEKSLYWRFFCNCKSEFSTSFIGKVETLYSVYSMKSEVHLQKCKMVTNSVAYNLIENMNLDSLFGDE